jgi:hypothetical protein
LPFDYDYVLHIVNFTIVYTYHQILLDKRNKNKYGVGVRISTVTPYTSTLSVSGRWVHHLQSSFTYPQILLDTRNKNINGLGVDI